MSKVKGRNMTFNPNKSSSNFSNFSQKNKKTEQQKKAESQIQAHKKTRGFWPSNMEQRDEFTQGESETKNIISKNSKGIPMKTIQQELGELYSDGNLHELEIRIAFAKQLFVNKHSKSKDGKYNHPFSIALQFMTEELTKKEKV